MNRRVITSALPLVALSLVGCEPEHRLSAKTERSMSSLEKAIGGLEESVREFNEGNWQEVVPKVEAQATNVSSAFRALKEALEMQG